MQADCECPCYCRAREATAMNVQAREESGVFSRASRQGELETQGAMKMKQ